MLTNPHNHGGRKVTLNCTKSGETRQGHESMCNWSICRDSKIQRFKDCRFKDLQKFASMEFLEFLGFIIKVFLYVSN